MSRFLNYTEIYPTKNYLSIVNKFRTIYSKNYAYIKIKKICLNKIKRTMYVIYNPFP